MKLTFLGHSSFLITIGSSNLLVDPFFPNGMPQLECKVDYILLTHGHQDHINNVDDIQSNHQATVISTYEVATYFINKGYKGIQMNHGGDIDLPFGNLKLVNAVHSSSFPDGKYAGNPCGFVLTSADKCLYIAGDTALTYDMKLIPMTSEKLDAAILPIGNRFTMGYKDARIASDFIECDKIIACHFNTFPPLEVDKDEVTSYFAEKGKSILLLDINQQIDL